MRVRSISVRRAVAFLAIASAVLALVELTRWRTERRSLRALLNSSGAAADRPEVLADLDRSPGVARSRLRVGRAVLADQLDLRFRPGAATPSDEEIERGLAALAATRRLAAEVLASQPGSWQAAMLLGGATYLEWSRRGDPRLATERQAWARPLEHAVALAPGQPEPIRLLVATYLGEWTRLSPEERAAHEPLVRRALADPQSFELLFRPWLRLAPTLKSAFGAIPHAPWAWERVAGHYAAEADWERYCLASDRRVASLTEHLDRRLAEARRRAGGGDWHSARALLRSTLGQLPLDPDSLPKLQAILALEPPGGFGGGLERTFQAWLNWTLDRCRFDSCPIEPALLLRLAGGRAQVAPAEAAQVAIVGRSVSAAALPDGSPRAVEVRQMAVRRALAAGDLGTARTALEDLAEAAGRGPLYWSLAERVAAAGGDQREIEAAAKRLAELATAGPATETWRRVGKAWRVEFWTGEPLNGLRVAWLGGGGGGGAFSARLDGKYLGHFPVSAGSASRIDLETAPGIHLLEITPAAGTAPPPALLGS